MKTIRPVRSEGAFAAFGLCDSLLRAISEAGFQDPRPIQSKTIPEVLSGRDVMGLAQTGTGKTAAFALPMIERLIASRGKNPRGLILAPTRELAMQIHKEIELLARYTDIRAITVFGGVGIGPQVRALRARPDIIVACPGRLLDLLGSGSVRLDGIEVLVLDEADQMLDMGFLPDIRRILGKLPPRRQSLLFSATMPKEVRALTDQMLRNPHVVELAHRAPLETIEHFLFPVDQKRKADLLRHLMHAEGFDSTIVFLRTKHRARRLAQDLDRAGHRAVALQGNMTQAQRHSAMQGFRDGRYDVLVATDIASRGIDVANVSHVVNFDIPDTPDAYTHRIGRTGRSDSSGRAYTFVTHEDFPAIKTIERTLNMEIPRVKLREFKIEGGKQAAERGESRRPRRWEKKPNGRPGGPGRRSRGAPDSARAKPIYVGRSAPEERSPATKQRPGASKGRPASQEGEGGPRSARKFRHRGKAKPQSSTSSSSNGRFNPGARGGKGAGAAKRSSGGRPKSGTKSSPKRGHGGAARR